MSSGTKLRLQVCPDEQGWTQPDPACPAYKFNVHARDSTLLWSNYIEGKTNPLPSGFKGGPKVYSALQAVLPGEYKLVHGKDFSASIIYLAVENCGKTRYVCDLQHICEFQVTDFDIATEGAEQ